MLHLWRAEAQGFGLLPKITHSLREVKWGTDPFPSVRYTVEFQCLRDRAMSAPISFLILGKEMAPNHQVS